MRILRSKKLIDWSFENAEAKIFVKKSSSARRSDSYSNDF